MSFRNTFVTDFIYQASPETVDANVEVEKIFREYAARLDSLVDDRGYGYFAGWIKTLDGSLDQMELHRLVRKLEKATRVPFRLTVLVESGPILTYEIAPKKEVTPPGGASREN